MRTSVVTGDGDFTTETLRHGELPISRAGSAFCFFFLRASVVELCGGMQ